MQEGYGTNKNEKFAKKLKQERAEAFKSEQDKKWSKYDKIALKRQAEREKKLKEDAPTNAMGLSSSDASTGAIDTYDPALDLGGGKVKNKMRKKLFDILRRKLQDK